MCVCVSGSISSSFLNFVSFAKTLSNKSANKLKMTYFQYEAWHAKKQIYLLFFFIPFLFWFLSCNLLSLNYVEHDVTGKQVIDAIEWCDFICSGWNICKFFLWIKRIDKMMGNHLIDWKRLSTRVSEIEHID